MRGCRPKRGPIRNERIRGIKPSPSNGDHARVSLADSEQKFNKQFWPPGEMLPRWVPLALPVIFVPNPCSQYRLRLSSILTLRASWFRLEPTRHQQQSKISTGGVRVCPELQPHVFQCFPMLASTSGARCFLGFCDVFRSHARKTSRNLDACIRTAS